MMFYSLMVVVMLQTLFLQTLVAAYANLSTNPAYIDAGLSPSLDVNCTFAIDKSTPMAEIISLTLSRGNNTELGSITDYSDHQVNVISSEGITADGVINPGGQSYIHLHWDYPTETQTGTYQCSAQGMDVLGHIITVSDTAVVIQDQVDMGDLMDKIREMDERLSINEDYTKGLEEKLVETNNQITDLEERLVQNKNYTNELEANLTQTSNYTKDLEEKWETNENYTKELEADLAQTSNYTKDLEEKLETNENYTKELEANLAQTGNYTKDLDEKLEKNENYTKELKENLTQTSNYTKDLEEKLETNENYTKELEANLTQTGNYTSNLEDLLLQYEAYIKDLEQNVSGTAPSANTLMQIRNNLLQDKFYLPGLIYQGKTYVVSKSPFIDFNDAINTCKDYIGQLAELNDINEYHVIQDYLRTFLGFNTVYMGGTDENHDGRWVLPSSNEDLPVTDWASFQPKHGETYNCLSLYNGWRWRMESNFCHWDDVYSTIRYMCELYN